MSQEDKNMSIIIFEIQKSSNRNTTETETYRKTPTKKLKGIDLGSLTTSFLRQVSSWVYAHQPSFSKSIFFRKLAIVNSFSGHFKMQIFYHPGMSFSGTWQSSLEMWSSRKKLPLPPSLRGKAGVWLIPMWPPGHLH